MDEPNHFASDGIEYIRIDVEDRPTEKIGRHFHPAADWINDRVARGVSVLVHCRGGISRSPSVVRVLIRSDARVSDLQLRLLGKALRCDFCRVKLCADASPKDCH